MKKIVLFYFIIFPIYLFSQTHNYTFSELKGMEDNQGNTHLFYRQYYREGNNIAYTFDNSIYHLDISTGSDTEFLYDGGYIDTYPNPNKTSSHDIIDFEFWDNNPINFIYLGDSCEWACFGYVQRYDDSAVQNGIFFYLGGYKIEISKQNDSLLYSNSQYLVKSTDGGKNWSVVDSAYKDYVLVSLSPFNDKEIFAIDSDSNLVKTDDGCKTFNVVDSSKISLTPALPDFEYDKDNMYVYRTSSYNDSSSNISVFFISSSKGEANTWTKKYSSTHNLYLSIDDSVSGLVYLADSNKILESTDYGNTFNVYKTLDSSIVGIYKKPASDILYAATKYDIYEITPSSIKSIKHLTVDVKEYKNNLPSEYILYQNYPNPFNPSTTIKYQIPKSGLVQLKVYDILGREVATLVNEVQTAGEHSVLFSAGSRQLASGVYFYRLRSGNYISTKKFILLD